MLNCENGDLSTIEIDKEIAFDEYSEIFTDFRLMFGLLTGFYHWNNADVGSLYSTRRYPIDNFRLNVQGYLNFFTAI